MAVELIVTDEFREWYEALSEPEQNSIQYTVELLHQLGVGLRYPHSTGLNGSRYPEMRELRIQHAGEPYRVLYAFDPDRQAVLLVGGVKTGKDRWYESAIRHADRLWERYLREIE